MLCSHTQKPRPSLITSSKGTLKLRGISFSLVHIAQNGKEALQKQNLNESAMPVTQRKSIKPHVEECNPQQQP